MTPTERAEKRAKYRRLIALRDYFQSLADLAKAEIWADEPSEFWRGIREAKEEVDTWSEWKRDACRAITHVEPVERKDFGGW